MLLPYHKPDIKANPNEAEFDEAINKLGIASGFYMYPNCQNAKDMKSEAFKARWKSGPWGTINVMGHQPNFAMNLLKTFIAYGLITVMVAYISGMALGPGADYMNVFRVVATAGILGHCMGALAGSFFLGTPTRFIVTCFIDGVIFAGFFLCDARPDLRAVACGLTFVVSAATLLVTRRAFRALFAEARARRVAVAVGRLVIGPWRKLDRILVTKRGSLGTSCSLMFIGTLDQMFPLRTCTSMVSNHPPSAR